MRILLFLLYCWNWEIPFFHFLILISFLNIKKIYHEECYEHSLIKRKVFTVFFLYDFFLFLFFLWYSLIIIFFFSYFLLLYGFMNLYDKELGIVPRIYVWAIPETKKKKVNYQRLFRYVFSFITYIHYYCTICYHIIFLYFLFYKILPSFHLQNFCKISDMKMMTHLHFFFSKNVTIYFSLVKVKNVIFFGKNQRFSKKVSLDGIFRNFAFFLKAKFLKIPSRGTFGKPLKKVNHSLLWTFVEK